MVDKDVVLTLDIGTTNIKLAAIDRSGTIICIHKRPLKTQSPTPGYLEICPTELWSDIVALIELTCKGLESRIAAFGISNQRGTFITWKRDTNEYLHNFITWADQRTAKMCDDWNNSYVTRLGQSILYGIGKVVGSTHMVCAACFKVRPANVQIRLKWVMENIPAAKTLYAEDKLCFGTLDTWVIYKLTCGATWATDYTNAGGTGIYDLWTGKWCPVMTKVFGNPIGALPEVRDCNASFGKVSPDLNFGFSVPIHGVLADQQASVVGSRLFKEGDVKISLGTSLCCDRLTGSYVHPVALAVYPQIAWKLTGEDICYLAESQTLETRGQYLDWLVTNKLVERIDDVDSVALSVDSNNGVFFVKDDIDYTKSIEEYIVGATSDSDSSNIVCAVMEAHVFRSKTILDNVFSFYGTPGNIVVDGGASVSNFILENLSKLIDPEVFRSNCIEGPLMGTFFMTGLGLGWWKNFEDIQSPISRTKISPSNENGHDFLEKFEKWKILSKF